MEDNKDISMRFSGDDTFKDRTKDRLLSFESSAKKSRNFTLKGMFSRKKSALNDDVSSMTSFEDPKNTVSNVV